MIVDSNQFWFMLIFQLWSQLSHIHLWQYNCKWQSIFSHQCTKFSNIINVQHFHNELELNLIQISRHNFLFSAFFFTHNILLFYGLLASWFWVKHVKCIEYNLNGHTNLIQNYLLKKKIIFFSDRWMNKIYFTRLLTRISQIKWTILMCEK